MVYLRRLAILDMILKVLISCKIVHLARFRNYSENVMRGRSF